MYVLQDTMHVNIDTMYVLQDTMHVDIDSMYVLQDTMYVYIDSMYVLQDTMHADIDSMYVLQDSPNADISSFYMYRLQNVNNSVVDFLIGRRPFLELGFGSRCKQNRFHFSLFSFNSFRFPDLASANDFSMALRLAGVLIK